MSTHKCECGTETKVVFMGTKTIERYCPKCGITHIVNR